jgi:large subunit ribosomal protein L31e
MAEKKLANEREYVINLRREWLRVPQYERTGRAVKAIKKFIAKHMKVADRDVKKVKLDIYFNNELWFKGRANPPAKIKVKAIRDGENIKVSFAETPQYVKFLQAKHQKMHKKTEKKETPVEEKKEEAKPEEKKAEQEKEIAVAEQHLKEAKADAKAEKHTTKPQKTIHPQRMALQK